MYFMFQNEIANNKFLLLPKIQKKEEEKVFPFSDKENGVEEKEK